ncbi:MAG: hypothetical protein K0S38_1099 [Candidatus Paceibacter sp.]|jgi:hypothetical protein|nr:hypothetical protein [Candidatus Paceibacter sp.]
MIEIIDTVTGGNGYANRDVDRSDYLDLYKSANTINYKPSLMPQTARGVYRRSLMIGKIIQTVTIEAVQQALSTNRHELAEVMEGFPYGLNNWIKVQKYGNIFIAGSLAKLTGKTGKTSIFCPLLFWFNDILSFGIEPITTNDNDQPLLIEGSYCLIREKCNS